MHILFVGLIVCLVNSECHVETLPPLYGTFTQNKDVMTSKNVFKQNHITQPQIIICVYGLA